MAAVLFAELTGIPDQLTAGVLKILVPLLAAVLVNFGVMGASRNPPPDCYSASLCDGCWYRS
jgi:hypothetical protein